MRQSATGAGRRLFLDRRDVYFSNFLQIASSFLYVYFLPIVHTISIQMLPSSSISILIDISTGVAFASPESSGGLLFCTLSKIETNSVFEKMTGSLEQIQQSFHRLNDQWLAAVVEVLR